MLPWSVIPTAGCPSAAAAATTSPTRAALIEAGEYTARSWIVAFPRAALIKWADGRKAAEMRERMREDLGKE